MQEEALLAVSASITLEISKRKLLPMNHRICHPNPMGNLPPTIDGDGLAEDFARHLAWPRPMERAKRISPREFGAPRLAEAAE